LKVYVGYERYEVGCVHYDTTSTDFCSVVTCVNNGTCVNKPTTHVCLCTPQFYGDFCQWGTYVRAVILVVVPSLGSQNPVSGFTEPRLWAPRTMSLGSQSPVSGLPEPRLWVHRAPSLGSQSPVCGLPQPRFWVHRAPSVGS